MYAINGGFAYHYAANPVNREALASGSVEIWSAEDNRVAFGQHSARPAQSVDGGLTIAFSGALDNLDDLNRQLLRQNLRTKGVASSADSPAEALLQLYAWRGEAMARDLRGAFAFALWDAGRRALILARGDSSGSPLYYTNDGWTLRFASRTDELSANGAASLDAQLEVREFPAGCFMLVDALGPREAARFGSGAAPSLCRAAPRRAKRVLALLTDGFGGHGGIAQYNRDFLTALAMMDDISEVAVLPRWSDVHPRDLPPRVRQYPAAGSKSDYSAKAIWLALTAGPFDLVFCGHPFMAPLGAAAAKLLRAPMWLQLHGVDAWDPLGRLTRWGAAQSARVTAVSRYTRHRFLQWADVDPSRVSVLSNTFEARFSAGPKPLHLLERHGLQGKKVLLTVSRLWSSERYKGHDRVIRVLPQVLAEGHDAVYIVVGDGDDLPRLQAEAAEAGVSGRVVFTGRVSETDLPDYYRAADVFVMPSTGEGFGIAFLEAAAAGVPVIGGDCDGSVDALADGAIGLPVDPHDPQALAAAISSRLREGRPAAIDVGRFSRLLFTDHVRALAREIMTPPRQNSQHEEKFQFGAADPAYRTP
jgi:phosphatidyl-myo-inositol dimannoside synthase